MHVYVFHSRRDPRVVAFSREESGRTLPQKLGPWVKLDGAALSVGGEIGGLGSSDPVIAAIEEYGFYVAQAKAERTRPDR